MNTNIRISISNKRINDIQYNQDTNLDKADVDGSLAEALTAHVEAIFTDDSKLIGWMNK
jgi:hypothetical protein